MMHRIIFPCLAMLMFQGCMETQMTLPGDFVELERNDPGCYGFALRGLSADQCIIALRVEENLKNGSAAFWSQTIQAELTDRGYELLGEEPIQNDAGLSGVLQKYARKDKSYWVALFVKEKHVAISEAGGQTAAFKSHEKEIRKAFQSITF